MTLTALCTELKNWFDTARISGVYTITNGEIDLSRLLSDGTLQTGQYFRIAGSVFNDGVYQYRPHLSGMTDETFDGVIWIMRVPPEIITLMNEISTWEKNSAATIASPYKSESFGGYSYTLKDNGGGDVGTWQNAFRHRLNRYRKVRPV